YAYELDDGVYFDVSKDDDYGKLSNRDPEQMEAGARLEVNAKKRNPGDFALWKGAKPDEPSEVQFDSPFKCGRGRPGWHIECTCMAIRTLGETLDIHGGGLDLQFPHHENELAQSESLTGKDFAHVWMHNGLLKMGKDKMAGSVGNVVNIADLLKRHSPDTIRFLLLSTHYRSPIEYSEERLEEVKRSLESFYRYFERYERAIGESFYTLPELSSPDLQVMPGIRELAARSEPKHILGSHGNEFLMSMNDDFNTGAATGVLFQLLNEANAHLDSLERPRSSELQVEMLKSIVRYDAQQLRTMTNILGLFWAPPQKKTLAGALAGTASIGSFSTTGTLSASFDGPALEQWNRSQEIISGLMQLLLDLRNNLRTIAKEATKDNPLKKSLFEQTDLIRTRLGELGVTLEDRPGGTTWRVG
ncbi:MAG: hypothetical protein L0241_31365, partial [Planctomycetia bacterium]|nr:hypothetical protein [Planctomycetia bacterium]